MTAGTAAGGAPGRWTLGVFCTLALLFLIAPVLVVIPLSFNAEPYFTFTAGMLRLDPDAYSLRWYEQVLFSEEWQRAALNSCLIGLTATAIATTLGTLAAVGLSSPAMPWRRAITALLISPMIVPIVIAAAGMFFFYSSVNLTQTYTGLILSHAALGAPFVVITVTAAMAGFNRELLLAAASLGAGPLRGFFKVQLPLISPGVIAGALFAFAASLDEVVVVLFMGGIEQRTIPRQMWSGIREEISPAILAAATFLIVIAMLLLVAVEVLQHRSSRRGARPAGAERAAR
ncbi:MAG: ABC transporter permease [Rhodospirillaceae bacterium]|nr:ABC transporter permease [Rhodospirillaceae bacterium]